MAIAKPVRRAPIVTGQRELSSMEESRRALVDQERGLLIDVHDLDGEWERHSERYHHAAKQCNLAESYRDKAKTDLAKIEAIADEEARNEVATAARIAAERDSKAKPEKATETQIKSRVVLHPKVEEAQRVYFEWVHLAKDWQALVTSLHERRYALENETRLYLSSYYEKNGARGGENDMKDAIAREVRNHGR